MRKIASTVVLRRKYAYIASLRFNPEGKTFCGGTLIAPQYISTAGHCIKTDKGQIYASIGSEYGSGAASGSGEQIKVVEGFRHPLYNNAKHLYDVGLLKLETQSTQKVASLCAVDGSDNKVGTIATVLGWGLTEDRVGSLTLQEVNVAIISNGECDMEYGGNYRITEGMMCAGNGEGKDSCNGDSGGPLLVRDILVGLVSWGGKCGVKAGVYSRLSFVMDYIYDVLNGATDSIFPAPSISSALKDPALSSEAEPATTAKAVKTTKTDGLAAEASSAGKDAALQSTTPQETPSTNIITEPLPTQPSASKFNAGTLANEAPVSAKGCNVRRRRR
ncbi:unnamed protein product [Phytophthora lilii]|uniref:Unnamed protein product n=1 Tax=Phytophthora lilii TaxID=2077276 RepID=A0A9W6X307_9STRA|nr:unnamed protein product [Phytophthora lilii]